MALKTRWYIVKLETPASKCACGATPCTHQYVTTKLQMGKGGRMAYVPMKGNGARRICGDCREKLIGQICNKSLKRWHETPEEKEARQND